MLPHNYYQDNVGYQQPIKNDLDSQALPSDDEWDTMRNQNKAISGGGGYSQNRNINNNNVQQQYQQQQQFQSGMNQGQYQQNNYQQQNQGYQQQRGYNQDNINYDRNYQQKVVNDPFPSSEDYFNNNNNNIHNNQYKPSSNRQPDSHSNYQQQIYAPTGMTQPSKNNLNTNPSQHEINDSPVKLNNLKKSSLVSQLSQLNSNGNNNIPHSQFSNRNIYGGNGQENQYNQQTSVSQQNNNFPNQQQSNFGNNPLGHSSSQTNIRNGQQQQQSYKTEATQIQAENQHQQQQQRIQMDSIIGQSNMNTTNMMMDNYQNDQSPAHLDNVNITTQPFNVNQYTDQPLVTPTKNNIKQQDMSDFMNKTDLNITNTLPNNNNNNQFFKSSTNNSNNYGIQQQLEKNQLLNQQNINNNNGLLQQQNSQFTQNYNDGYYNNKNNGQDDRTSLYQRESQNDGGSYKKQNINVNHPKNNYSGMYTYQINNINNRNPITGSAHIQNEGISKNNNSNNKQYDNEGKIINVDDPYFLDNYDPQNINMTQFMSKKFSPLEISYLKKAQKILNTEFFYDKLPRSYTSFIVPEYKKPLYRHLILEYILPMIAVFLLHLFLWGVQISVSDYCFEGSSFCKCSSFSIKLWTFFRQLIAWKLGMICYKNIVMIEIGEERYPLMECVLMYIVAIGIDFVMVAGIGMNQDWQFYIMIFIVGYVLTIHTIKFKQFTHIFSKGSPFYLYDLNLLGIVIFIYYALPAIYKSLIERLNFTDGRNTFIYLYPLLEWVFELFSNYILERAQIAEFYQYQMYLFILGMKVGIMTSISTSTFEFWYLGSLFCIKRIFESTNILYINARKLIYKMFPANLKYMISMSEFPDYRKGREGYFLENLVWLGMYYWWFYTETIVPGYVKSYVVISDCEFSAKGLFKNISWDRPFFTWIFLFAATIISVITNSNLRLDMIKWVGASKHNLLENIFTRMFGWYLFQVALVVSYSFSREDIDTYTNF